ncbi:acetate--CoA ligase family protein [Anabaenopsis elenkinii]|uniref:Acetate--CoA ligase family protein n=1 Tax=Anabaenopsis elenkinii CCIBt3563 TaxID=2779889 RepID=A0A7U3NLJ4_9CYAN|nr:acetate--CoA ligase family protein [Anabaenopsis elenkinii CCIBt3563]
MENSLPRTGSGFHATEKQKPLHAIFKPKTVAVIGASEKKHSVGRTLLWNLISNPFGGTVFPVNPKHHSILGIKAYPTVFDVPEPIDLAVIATPAPTVPGIIKQCVAVGVKGAIILSAGFKEIGTQGVILEQEIQAEAQGKIRIIGPNCLGVMAPLTGLNATFASQIARGGNVGFISQSGALCTAILDWSFRENVGFSAFVSLGSMVDIGWGDLIDYLGDDPETKSIIIYMESIGDASSFLCAARKVALTKPIIVIKAGRTAAAAQAAASHTGAMAGSDEVLDAAFRRCGVLRVNSISDLFNMAELLAKQPRPSGPRLTILTNAGGPGVLATDALIAAGGQIAPIPGDIQEKLQKILPPHSSLSNPIDILGDADPQRYSQALQVALNTPESDGLLVILTPQAMTDPTQTAQVLADCVQEFQQASVVGERSRTVKTKPVPILVSWMGGEEVAEGQMILNKHHIPTYPYPDTAARMFCYMWQSSYNLRGIYETPVMSDSSTGTPDYKTVEATIAAARTAQRQILTELESKQILQSYGINIVPTEVAYSPAAAVKCAETIGYPVVLKLFSHTITHKTDVGGVQLNLMDSTAVTQAYNLIRQQVEEKDFLGVTVQPMVKTTGYELIVGSSIDAQFGPVLLFGAGGQLAEVFKDYAIALPPLNTTLARRMIEQTQIYQALTGVRGRKSIDLAALEKLMVVFSRLVVEQPRIKEIDINPLLASSEKLIALDARIILHDPELPDQELPKLAIRPYST